MSSSFHAPPCVFTLLYMGWWLFLPSIYGSQVLNSNVRSPITWSPYKARPAAQSDANGKSPDQTPIYGLTVRWSVHYSIMQAMVTLPFAGPTSADINTFLIDVFYFYFLNNSLIRAARNFVFILKPAHGRSSDWRKTAVWKYCCVLKRKWNIQKAWRKQRISVTKASTQSYHYNRLVKTRKFCGYYITQLLSISHWNDIIHVPSSSVLSTTPS